uniref:TIL domain-containing protein n=1 Tax=Steinernema glaseri TaxID=37863 RepID=A0A1I7YZG5_9BILA
MKPFVFAALFAFSLAWVVEEEKCGPHEAWVDCPHCEPTCQQPTGLLCMRFGCQEGCGCQAPFVRHNDECVIYTDCPNLKKNATAPSKKCGAHQTYHKACGPCFASCEAPDHEECVKFCTGPGCFCDAPYVMLNDKCVLPEECPDVGGIV